MDPVALANAGPWAVVVAIMVAIGWGAVKGHWVPGFVYRREVERADTLTAQLDRNTDSLEKLTKTLDRARRDVDGRA